MKKIMPLEQILAKNITALMAHIPDVETYEKFAKRSGVGKGTVERIAKCEVSTGIATVERLSEAVGVSPVWLLTYHTDPAASLKKAAWGEAEAGTPGGDVAERTEPLKLTCETAQELKMLSVYRLSGPENRKLIDLAVEDAASDIEWADAFNERK